MATFHLVVAPGQTGSVVITIRASRLRKSNLDADAGAAFVDWSRVTIEALDPRLQQTVSAGLDDLQHLLLTDPDEPTSIFAAAGTHWYLPLFGRDSIWAARMALPFGTELAAGTLRALARRQGRVVDPDSAEAPGKIPHELRRTTYADVAQPASRRPLADRVRPRRGRAATASGSAKQARSSSALRWTDTARLSMGWAPTWAMFWAPEHSTLERLTVLPER